MKDARRYMKWFLRGGPPWTTKLRLCLLIPLALPFVIVSGGGRGAIEYLTELASEVRDAWKVCDEEDVRRLGEKMRA